MHEEKKLDVIEIENGITAIETMAMAMATTIYHKPTSEIIEQSKWIFEV